MPATETIICECGCATVITEGIFFTGAYNRFEFNVDSIRVNGALVAPGDRFFVDATHLQTWADNLLNPP